MFYRHDIETEDGTPTAKGRHQLEMIAMEAACYYLPKRKALIRSIMPAALRAEVAARCEELLAARKAAK